MNRSPVVVILLLLFIGGCRQQKAMVETSDGRFSIEEVKRSQCIAQDCAPAGFEYLTVSLKGDSPGAFLPDSDKAYVSSNNGSHFDRAHPGNASVTVTITADKQVFDAWFLVSSEAKDLKLHWAEGPGVSLESR
jgi:hypothetical protein